MSTEDNKAVAARWSTDFWGSEFDASVIDELAAPDIRFEYSAASGKKMEGGPSAGQ